MHRSPKLKCIAALHMSAPHFPLNADVESRTRAPPVQVAAAWAGAYPSVNAPQPSATLLPLSQGAPGYGPPTVFTERIASESKALSAHAYTHGLGEPVLRKAVAQDICSAYGTNTVTADNIAITCGCNMAFAASVAAIAERGDSVVLPYPWYFNHEMTLTAMGINVIPIHASDGTVNPEDIRPLLRDRVRAVVIVTPSNPTGTTYTSEKLAATAQICREKRVALIIDETCVTTNELPRIRIGYQRAGTVSMEGTACPFQALYRR